ncbi:hypothetical protein [Magnetospirillum molischianum]|uniref:Uncharacterized protein n=1 Tax=Magnetospirillum molischianum DSM 120 TaxID=1150626 RepID=H8FSY7_MAGML|nr:hypothetical protein [Magnetospirillum molischianum]CCG41475.1 conserved hypothetical protein [Magnetospirillum molischianum DSM 120]
MVLGSASGAASRRGLELGKSSDPSIAAVKAGIEGEVIEVMWREIPNLRSLPRGSAYDVVMNDPRMLDECLRLFRSRPDLFRDIVTDANHQPVTSDQTILSCGRSLGDAIALVVRASARRHFRQRLDGRVRMGPPVPQPSALKRMAIAFGLASAPVAKTAPRAPSRSDVLYRAIRSYLRFDWQVPLIPHYAPMTPALVADLGARLLDVREVAELRALSAPGVTPRDGRPPLLLDNARRLLLQGRDAIDAEILWRVVQQMHLARLFPDAESDSIRRVVAQVSAVHSEVIRALLPVLGNDIRRFTVFLMVAFVTLGEQRFKQDFCHEGRGYAVRKLGERLDLLPPPPPTLDEMSRVYKAVLATAYVGGVEAKGESLLKAHPELVRALDAMGNSRSAPAAITG